MKRTAVLSGMIGMILPFASTAAPRLEYFTFGIMLHWNFGGGEFRAFSYGLEAAYWNYEKEQNKDGFLKNSPNLDQPGYSLDLGIETDRNGIRLYSEPQVGW